MVWNLDDYRRALQNLDGIGPEGIDEGERCNRGGCGGVLIIAPSENCACHLYSPCRSCTNPNRLRCPECGWRDEA